MEDEEGLRTAEMIDEEEETPSQSVLELPFGHPPSGQGSFANQTATAPGLGQFRTAGHTTLQRGDGQPTHLSSPRQKETPHQDLRTAAQPNWALTQAALEQAGTARRSSGEAEASEEGSDDNSEEESDDEDETGAAGHPPKGPVNPGVAPGRAPLAPPARTSQGLDGGEESDGDDDAEGGEEEEEEDTPLVFDADFPVDPLSLVDQQDEPGHEFERYTKLQYEMLAERKRKALGGGQASEPPQKKQKAALYGASVDDIYGAEKGELDQHFDKQEERRRGRRGLERKRGRRPGPRGLPAEVTRKLGQANLFYAMEQYQEAVDVLVEVVRLAPNVADSYHTLGLCHEALGDRRKALNFYMIAAHLTPKDSSLWRRLAAWSTEQNNPAQAIHCLSKVIRWEPHDVDARWDRAVLMAEVGDVRNACREFEKLHAERPADVEVAKMLARMFHKMGHAHKATAVLEDTIQRLPPHHVDLTAVNILAELHMEAGSFGAAVTAMTSARDKMGGPFPLDLEVKLGICYAYLGDFASAAAHTEPLREKASEECADLLMDIADAYFAVGRAEDAMRFYALLSGFPAYSQPALWLKMGRCQALSGEYEAAAKKLRRVLTEHPDSLDARILLSDALMHLEKFEEGLRVLEPSQASMRAHQASGEEPWWESVRVRIMRAKFRLAQGSTEAFLEAALPLVEQTIDGEFEARQRRALAAQQFAASRADPDAKTQDPDARPADVFAGYVPIRQTRKKQKTKREKREERAAAEAAAKRALESGVNGDQDTEPGVIGDADAEPPVNGAQEAGKRAGVRTHGGETRGHPDVNIPGIEDEPGGAERGESTRGGDADADVSMTVAGSPAEEERQEAQTVGQGGESNPPPVVPIPDVFTLDESFQLLYEVVKGLADTGRVQKASGIVQRLLLFGKNAPPGKRLSAEQRRQLKQLTLGVEYNSEQPPRDRERDTLKNMCKEQPDNMRLWNEFHARMTRSGGYLPHRKWLFMLRVKHPNSVPIAMLCGHQYASTQKFASALREYQRAHTQRPDEPLISLCIGLAFLHHAMSRRTSHRNRAVLQGFAFLYKYHRLSGVSQEADFNLGRAYHQLGLAHLAVPYYEKALSAGFRAPGRTDDEGEETKQGPGRRDTRTEAAGDVPEGVEDAPRVTSPPSKADITRRAAHNLALIFQKSGAHLLADQLRRDYLNPEET